MLHNSNATIVYLYWYTIYLWSVFTHTYYMYCYFAIDCKAAKQKLLKQYGNLLWLNFNSIIAPLFACGVIRLHDKNTIESYATERERTAYTCWSSVSRMVWWTSTQNLLKCWGKREKRVMQCLKRLLVILACELETISILVLYLYNFLFRFSMNGCDSHIVLYCIAISFIICIAACAEIKASFNNQVQS